VLYLYVIDNRLVKNGISCNKWQEQPKQWEPEEDFNSFIAWDSHMPKDLYHHLKRQYKIWCYVKEFGGDWVADWNDLAQRKWFVFYSYNRWEYFVWEYDAVCTTHFEPGIMFMSESCAKKLCDDLNSGKVVL
jgi:hypothetical protein